MTKPWYWRSLPLEHRTGSDIFAALFCHSHASSVGTLLESPYPNTTDSPHLCRYSICAGGPRSINGHLKMWTPAIGQTLPFLRQLLQTRKPTTEKLLFCSSRSLPFTGGWLGWLGYDIAWEIEQLPYTKVDRLPFPVAFWYEPECFAILDHWQQILWLAASDEAGLDELNERLEKRTKPQQSLTRVQKKDIPAFNSPIFCTSQSEYEAAVNQAKKYIQAGDIFQANLSLRFQAQTAASGWEIYRALQQINPSPFACYFKTPWGEMMSCSPERLVLLQNRQVQTRPIAGTRARGSTAQQDRLIAAELLSNSKERAEHIMLVDLERNDLGRVCEWGSVKVDELLKIERYSHVMHLVSNIKGYLRAELDAVDLIGAVFPGGTITGCPKVRCIEIIEELEPVRRSLFYGSCGYLDWQGNLDLNILIRTLVLAFGSPFNTVWGQVGAGIVADSEPTNEWHESLHKAQAQLHALAKVLP